MPFTPAHAVVALPFVRTPLLPAAIAVGAMAPDLPLFVGGSVLTYQVTHTNVLVTSLVALLLLSLWYLLLRPAVRELSPAWIAERLPSEWDVTGAAVWTIVRTSPRGSRSRIWREDSVVFSAILAVSLTLGVLSHVLWDAFTHEGRWGVLLVPALTEQWGPLLGYKWLQYGSGVVGLTIIAVFALVWMRRRSPAPTVRVLPPWVRPLWWLSLPVTLGAAWAGGLVAFGPINDTFTYQHLAYRVLPPACAVWGVLTLLLCIGVIVRRRVVAAAADVVG